MKKKMYMCVVGISLLLLGCQKKADMTTETEATTATEEIYATEDSSKETETDADLTTTAEEKIAEPEFDEYYLVDYAVIAKKIKTGNIDFNARIDWNEIIDQCELIDSNKDGIPELYLVEKYGEPQHMVNVGIECYKNPMIAMYRSVSAAGDAVMYVDLSTEKLYLVSDYSTMMFSTASYNVLETGGWHTIAGWSRTWIEGTDDVEEHDEKTYWYRDEDITEEVYNNIDEIQGDNRELINDESIICVEADVSIENFALGMEIHLDELNVEYKKYEFDINGDGVSEIIYAVDGYTKQWEDNIIYDSDVIEETDSIICMKNNGEPDVDLLVLSGDSLRTKVEVACVGKRDINSLELVDASYEEEPNLKLIKILDTEGWSYYLEYIDDPRYVFYAYYGE